MKRGEWSYEWGTNIAVSKDKSKMEVFLTCKRTFFRGREFPTIPCVEIVTSAIEECLNCAGQNCKLYGVKCSYFHMPFELEVQRAQVGRLLLFPAKAFGESYVEYIRKVFINILTLMIYDQAHFGNVLRTDNPDDMFNNSCSCGGSGCGASRMYLMRRPCFWWLNMESMRLCCVLIFLFMFSSTLATLNYLWVIKQLY